MPVSWRECGHQPLELTFIPAKNRPLPLMFLHCLINTYHA